jgi:hypothetical protein
MFAIIGAVLFALALILELAGASISDTITSQTIITAGLLCVALHLAGLGTRVRNGTGGGFRFRRR